MHKDSSYQILVENSKTIKLDISDLFTYGGSEYFDLNINTFEIYKDIIEKYQDKGLYALIANIKHQHVLDFYRNKDYEEAFTEIEHRNKNL